jgi:hypothetical protein
MRWYLRKDLNLMKHFWFISVIVFSLILSACSSAAAPTTTGGSDSYSSPNLDTSYEGAMSVRNQLALGTLQLNGTEKAITAEQAAELVPLWQALRSTGKTGEAASEEVNALLGQIEGTLTTDQLAAIRDLQLLQSDIQDWAKANGLTVGAGGGQPGAGAGLSPEARATRQAEEGRTSSGNSGSSVSSALIDAVISYLESLQP